MKPKTIVMKLYADGDFGQLVHGQNKSVSIQEWVPGRVVPLLMDVANALAYLHAKQIAHNDIKSENLFVERRTDRVHLVLGDFTFAEVRSTTKRGVKLFKFSTAHPYDLGKRKTTSEN